MINALRIYFKGILICIFLISSITFANTVVLQDVHEDVQFAIQDRLLKDYSFLTRTDIEVFFVNKKNLIIPKRAASFEYDVESLRSILGRTIVPIKLKDKTGETFHTLQSVIKVVAKGPFYKTRRKIRRDEIISDQDIMIVKEDLYGMPPNAIRDLDALQGKTARTIISKHVLLTKSMLKNESVIFAGDVVSVILKQNNVVLRVNGVAKQSGAIGEKIRVRLDVGTKKVMKGVVVDSTTVHISYRS